MNDLTANPLYIDTPGPGVLLTEPLFVRKVRWVSILAAAGHQATMQDQTGRQVWASVAAGADYVESDHIHNSLPWNGLIVPVLSSGYLEIQLRGRLITW
jgi:hypothetical protein